MDSTATLLIGLLAGAFGTGYLVYGKKQGRVVAAAAGLALCIYPYFVDNLLPAVLIGLVLLALPFIFRV